VNLGDRLIDIVKETDWLMRALTAVRAVHLPDGCIGAGAIRNTVWDYLHNRTQPACPNDVDVAYYSRRDLSRETDRNIESLLAAMEPDLPWDVVNQAGVHLCCPAHFGYEVAPLTSIVEAVASWPETATAVAVALDDDGQIRVTAPFGLDDLFSMVIRRNPERCSAATFQERLASKK
jgi:hypothetical protein